MPGPDKIEMPKYGNVFRKNPEMAALAKAAWQKAVAHLVVNDWVTEPRLSTVDRYARACAEYEVLYPLAVEVGPTKPGPNGGEFFNYTWSAVEKLNERIGKFEVRLKMDPADGGRAPLKKGPKTGADKYLDD